MNGWAEMYQVRSAVGQSSRVLEYLTRVAADRGQDPGSGMLLFSSGTHEGDFLVVLTWPEGEPSPSGSELGQVLAHELSAFGLVHGTIWRSIGEPA